MSSCFCTGKGIDGLCNCQRTQLLQPNLQANMQNVPFKLPSIDLKCKCCNGSGVQMRSPDGLKVYCPACQGSGECPNINRNIKFPNLDQLKPSELLGPNTSIC